MVMPSKEAKTNGAAGIDAEGGRRPTAVPAPATAAAPAARIACHEKWPIPSTKPESALSANRIKIELMNATPTPTPRGSEPFVR
jgi:hypothetical protein